MSRPIKDNAFHEFARVELYKERILDDNYAKYQAELIGVDVRVLRDFNRGYYCNNPVTKILNYFISKNIIKLCPRTSEKYSISLKP